MPSLISTSDKLSMGNVFFDIHDTFKRQVTAFKTATEVVINTNPDNNVFFPGAPGSDTVTTIVQSGVICARIKYNPKQDLAFLNSNNQGASDQITLKAMEGIVRFKLDMTGAAYFRDVKTVRLDGAIYEPITTPRPHGLFKPDFETFYVKRVN